MNTNKRQDKPQMTQIDADDFLSGPLPVTLIKLYLRISAVKFFAFIRVHSRSFLVKFPCLRLLMRRWAAALYAAPTELTAILGARGYKYWAPTERNFGLRKNLRSCTLEDL
jgi:hypothetical protein